MRRYLLLVLFALVVAGCGTSNPGPAVDDGAGPKPLILISLDGFRWDYLDRYDAPTLERLVQEGVRAERLVPSFPSKTFPNHYTLVTGLRPDHHGIIANNMYDPDLDERFSLGRREAIEDARWWGGTPLWVSAEQQGLTSATYFWPGSEAAIGGVRPTYWKRFDDDVPGEDRVDEVLAWLDLPDDERPSFITLYYSDVDHAGHDAGPDAPETAEAVARVDAYLARLVEGLEARGLYDDVNLIVASDHGMAATSTERMIFLDDYIDMDDVDVIDWSPVAMLQPQAGRADSVVAALRGAHPALDVYRRDELPERLHFGTHRRVPLVVGIADEGWSITTHDYFERSSDRYTGGTHGYDPALPSMGALFVAHGPAFRSGVVVPPLDNVDVYPLMADLLGLRPAPHDGDLSATAAMRARQAVAETD